jgi:hypothetical protein
MQHLSGRILNPSLGQSFATEWASYQAVIPVNPFQPLGIDSEKTTLDTSGLGSKKESLLCDQASVSLRMSMGTSRWDSAQSSAIWKSLVTKRRGEFSARLKSSIAKAAMHLTNGSEYSSWPTASTRDHKGGYEGGRIRNGKVSMDTLDVAVQAYSEGGLLAQANSNTSGSRQESSKTKWATPSAFDWNQPETKEQWEKRAATQAEKGVNLHLPLKSQAIQVGNNWATPNAGDSKAGMSTGRKQKSLGQDVTLSLQNWMTPQARDWKGPQGRAMKGMAKDLPAQMELKQWATPNTLDHMALRSPEALLRQATTTRAGRTAPANLREQVDPSSVEIYKQASWPTPTVMEAGKIGNQPNFGQLGLSNHPAIVGLPDREKAVKSDSTAQQKQKITAKLSPRFVETLMGLPIGWVMPSCAEPMTTAPTSFVPSGTESYGNNASTPTELSLAN